jgi:hypothetical protein
MSMLTWLGRDVPGEGQGPLRRVEPRPAHPRGGPDPHTSPPSKSASSSAASANQWPPR